MASFLGKQFFSAARVTIGDHWLHRDVSSKSARESHAGLNSTISNACVVAADRNNALGRCCFK